MSQKQVLITGASSGIGLATAQLFYQHGWQPLLLSRASNRLNEAQATMKGSLAIGIDLHDSNVGEQVSEHLRKQSLTPLIIINNAGIYAQHAADEINPSLWHEQFQINFFSAVELTNAVLPFLPNHQGASIVNVSSTLGLRPVASAAAYSAAKAALINWTQSLALQLAPRGVRANVVCPGIVQTPIHRAETQSIDEQSLFWKKMDKAQPLARVGQAPEIANAIFFLATNQSAWTTGSTLVVDGGINL